MVINTKPDEAESESVSKLRSFIERVRGEALKRSEEAAEENERHRKIGMIAAKAGIANPLDEGAIELGSDAGLEQVGDIEIFFPHEDFGKDFERRALPIIESRKQADAALISQQVVAN